MASSRHSKRYGKYDARLMCQVQQVTYDFRTRIGRLDFPEGDCCDRTGAIDLFTAIDPQIRVIETFAGGKPDTFFRRNLGDGEWITLMM